ncbi:Sphingolipid C9-methyltransferase 1 [Fusarium oxysporum f. sp. albedinis]|nr:Sphingolipid C9-methyltransferase 1 [Fusarium oxysporum f. sp. albedinis]
MLWCLNQMPHWLFSSAGNNTEPHHHSALVASPDSMLREIKTWLYTLPNLMQRCDKGMVSSWFGTREFGHNVS